MRTDRRAAWAAMGVVVAGSLLAWGSASPGQLPAAKPVVTWEYRDIAMGNGGDLDESLNRFGAEGWELVAAFSPAPNSGTRYVFKRRKP